MTVPVILFSGCLPNSLEKEVEQTEKKNEKIQKELKKEKEQQKPENIKLSKEQEEIIDSLEGDVNSAVDSIEKDKRKPVAIKVPPKQGFFQNPSELSQYLSAITFQFHRGDITPEAFFNSIKPYLHVSFLGEMPQSNENQILAYETIQEYYTSQLKAPIASYELTNVETNLKGNEASYYRKYVLDNKEELFFITILKKEGDKWLLFDDSPSPAYEAKLLIGGKRSE